MMRGVIQVPAAFAASCASGDHALKIAIEGDRVAALPHQPSQAAGHVEIVKEQHRATRR
jgi:hypothetical protein